MVNARKIDYEEAITITGVRDVKKLHHVKEMETTPKWNNILLQNKEILQEEISTIIESMERNSLLPRGLDTINIFITNSTREERISSYSEQVRILYDEFLKSGKNSSQYDNLNSFEQNLILKYNWIPEAIPKIHTGTSTIFLPIDIILNKDVFNGAYRSGTKAMNTGLPNETMILTNTKTTKNPNDFIKASLAFVLAHEIGHAIIDMPLNDFRKNISNFDTTEVNLKFLEGFCDLYAISVINKIGKDLGFYSIVKNYGSNFRSGDKKEYDLSDLNSKIEFKFNDSMVQNEWFQNLFNNCAIESQLFLKSSPEYNSMSNDGKAIQELFLESIKKFNFNKKFESKVSTLDKIKKINEVYRTNCQNIKKFHI